MPSDPIQPPFSYGFPTTVLLRFSRGFPEVPHLDDVVCLAMFPTDCQSAADPSASPQDEQIISDTGIGLIWFDLYLYHLTNRNSYSWWFHSFTLNSDLIKSIETTIETAIVGGFKHLP